MKRYFLLAGIEHESKSGKYAIADDCFDVNANGDGLYLKCPDGEKYNLLDGGSRDLLELWKKLRRKHEDKDS